MVMRFMMMSIGAVIYTQKKILSQAFHVALWDLLSFQWLPMSQQIVPQSSLPYWRIYRNPCV